MINHRQPDDRQEQSVGFASVCFHEKTLFLNIREQYFELRIFEATKEYFELKVLRDLL